MIGQSNRPAGLAICLPFLMVLLTMLSLPADANESGTFSVLDRPGWQALLDGRIDEAEKHFSRKLKRNSQDALAAFGLEQVRNTQGRGREAFELACRAVRRGAGHPWLEVFLTDALLLTEFAEDGERLAQTLDDFRPTNRRERLLRRLYRTRVTKDLKSRIERYQALPFVRTWQLLGPFNNREKTGFQSLPAWVTDFPRVDLKIPRSGKNRPIRWFPLSQSTPTGKIDLQELLTPDGENLAFALTVLEMDKAGPVTLILGAAGAAELRVGTRQPIRYEIYGRYHPLQRAFTVDLPAGRTPILLTLAADKGGDLAFSLLAVQGRLEEAGDLQAVAASHYGPKDRVAQSTSAESAITRNDAGLDWGAPAVFHQAIKANPKDALSRLNQGYLFLDRGVDDRLFRLSRTTLEKAAADAPRCAFIQEFASLVQRDANTARTYLDQARKAVPESLPAAELELALLMRVGLIREAEDRAKALLKKQPSLEALLTLAEITEDRQWQPEAMENLRKAQALAPGRASLAQRLANGSVSHRETVDYLRRGLQRTGDDALRKALVEELLDGPLEEAKEAEALLRLQLQLNPYSTSGHLLLRDALLAQKKTRAAREHLQAALEILPQSHDLRVELGEAYLREDDRQQAIALWQEALALRPDNPQLRRYLQRILPERKHFYTPYEIALDEALKLRVRPEDHPRHNAAVLLDQGVTHVHAGGTRDMMVHFVRQALRQAGAKALSRYSISYDPKRERVEILAARVIQPDGSMLTAEKIQDREVKGGGGEGTIYSRGHVKTIHFPEVREGSIVQLKYVLEATAENLYGHAFEEAFYFGGDEPTRLFNYVLSYPEELGLQVKTFAQEKAGAKETVTRQDGRVTHRWDAQAISGLEMEPSMPPYDEVAPAIRASTFKDWADVGRWYWNLAKDSLELPEDLRRQVPEILKDARTDEEKLAAIYYFVIDRIRYVGIELGRNGYVPHSCERTWRTKYGDCKDTAVLFVSLLKEAGIEARLALVRTWDRGVEPTGLPGARRFNHAIACVPDLNGRTYWLDGTTDYNHVSELPVMDQGAFAVIVEPDGGRAVTIPTAKAEKNSETLDATVMLDPAGDAQIQVRLSYGGAYAPGYRRTFAAPERFRKGLGFFLGRRFPGSELVEFKTGSDDLKDLNVFFTFTLKVPKLAERRNGNWVLKPSLLPMNFAASVARQNERRNDLLIMLKRRRLDRIVLQLPQGARVTDLPKPLTVTPPFGQLLRQASAKSGVVTLTLDRSLKARRIAQKDYAAFRAFAHQMDGAEDALVVYKIGTRTTP